MCSPAAHCKEARAKSGQAPTYFSELTYHAGQENNDFNLPDIIFDLKVIYLSVLLHCLYISGYIGN